MAYYARRRASGHTPLAPLHERAGSRGPGVHDGAAAGPTARRTPPHAAAERDAWGRKIPKGAAAVGAGTSEQDPLEALQSQWKPFGHWERQKAAEQEAMAWLSSSSSQMPAFDLDLTSKPGPLSYEPLVPPKQKRAATPETPPESTFMRGGIGQGVRRDPRRGAEKARWTGADAAPRPQAGDWQSRLEEELRREEQRLEHEARERFEREHVEAEAAAKEWSDIEAAARAAAEAAREAQRARSPFTQQQQRQQKQQQQQHHWESSAGSTSANANFSQRSKEEELKARAEETKRAQGAQARQKRQAEATAAAQKKQAERDTKLVAEQESLWLKFERAHDQASSPANITLASVPLPPASNPLCLLAGASDDEKKKAVRKATLRWHPDKFTQKFGKKIQEGQSDAIHAAVTAVFQGINALRK